MAEYAPNPQAMTELENALNQLEGSLVDAGRSVAVVRRNVSQLASLVEVVRELELTMTRARQNLGMGAQAAEPQPSYEAQEPIAEEAPAAEAAIETAEPAPTGEGQPSHCLRLGVASKIGSLDLKAVDGSVNENPAVVDVALLDYDGRKATLKLWVNGAADPVGVRDALLGSLRRRLGDESDAEVEIDFEGAA